MARTMAVTPAEVVRQAAYPVAGAREDYDPLMDLTGDARFVLLGEASHGTHEFYQGRAQTTRRLVEERGFTGVAVEADWPDAYRVNRYVRGVSDDGDPDEALSDFHRFPTWMWRNRDVLESVTWLKTYNDSIPFGSRKAGFYGLDLYSLFASIEAVIAFLDKVDPGAAGRARARHGGLEHFGRETEAYGYAMALGRAEPCELAVVGQLVELQKREADYARRDGRLAGRGRVLLRRAERPPGGERRGVLRSMFRGGVSSWNLRDRHMAETLDALVAHFRRLAVPARMLVWAHNSHLGDARATEMGRAGELNLGQLVRERYGDAAVLVGFSTHHGTVTAASDWDGPAERKRVRPALPGSYEDLFHEAEVPGFLLALRGGAEVAASLHRPRLERAIGVVYRPETERVSHYFHAELPAQFDAVLHFDETRAVEPLELTGRWEAGDPPETFPFGL